MFSSIEFSQWHAVNWTVVFFSMLWSFLKLLLDGKFDMHKLFNLPSYLIFFFFFLPLRNIFNIKIIQCHHIWVNFSSYFLCAEVPELGPNILGWGCCFFFSTKYRFILNLVVLFVYDLSVESNLTFTFIYLQVELILINVVEVLFIASSC